MKLLGYALFTVAVVVATVGALVSRRSAAWAGWSHDEIDAAHMAALAQWRGEGRDAGR